MNYAQAKEVIEEHAPDLHLDPEVPGQPHICVRIGKSAPPFSIMLVTTDDAEADRKTLIHSLSMAKHQGV